MNARPGLPRGVVVLGLVSLVMDFSSEMIHSLLPVFLVTVLGASALSVGIIEGVAEATAAIAKVCSGVISDRIARRKPLVLLGYGLAALSKPLFPLANGVGTVLAARFLDRIGKGIRGAPRDALIADLTPRARQGAAYGLRQSLDTVGAVAGPLAAMGLMASSDDNFRLVFWIAAVPALACVLLIQFGVHEPAAAANRPSVAVRITRAGLAQLPVRYWYVVALAAVLTLARFSEAFLLLRAQSVGMDLAQVPLILIVMNVVYAASAYPIGNLFDRGHRRRLLVFGVASLIVADGILVWASSAWTVAVGAAVWGLHMGATQGLLSALVADAAPAQLRGTAFGLFNLVHGLALLVASVIAGALWTWLGPEATFVAGACFAGLALPGLHTRIARTLH
ncbi:MAG: MFS transporter [Wenzhouxiangellaceae bacterium]